MHRNDTIKYNPGKIILIASAVLAICVAAYLLFVNVTGIDLFKTDRFAEGTLFEMGLQPDNLSAQQSDQTIDDSASALLSDQSDPNQDSDNPLELQNNNGSNAVLEQEAQKDIDSSLSRQSDDASLLSASGNSPMTSEEFWSRIIRTSVQPLVTPSSIGSDGVLTFSGTEIAQSGLPWRTKELDAAEAAASAAAAAAAAIADATAVAPAPRASAFRAHLPPRDPNPKFNDLLAINGDVVGWIRIEGTNIDYPVLYDGTYDYLNYDINGKKTTAGCICMDPSNNIEFTNYNFLLHGHHMKNGTMFRDVVKYKGSDFFYSNRIIYFETLYDEMIWEVFSVYVFNANKELMYTGFSSDAQFLETARALQQRSMFDTTGMELKKTDSLLTLSTCSYEFSNARTVLHARLIYKNGEMVSEPSINFTPDFTS